MKPLDLPAGSSTPVDTDAQPRLVSEQSLIRQLYSCVWEVVGLYGSQKNAARALHVSAPTIYRLSPAWLLHNCPGRLPRPQKATLLAYSKCESERVRQVALALLKFRSL